MSDIREGEHPDAYAARKGEDMRHAIAQAWATGEEAADAAAADAMAEFVDACVFADYFRRGPRGQA